MVRAVIAHPRKTGNDVKFDYDMYDVSSTKTLCTDASVMMEARLHTFLLVAASSTMVQVHQLTEPACSAARSRAKKGSFRRLIIGTPPDMVIRECQKVGVFNDNDPFPLM